MRLRQDGLPGRGRSATTQPSGDSRCCRSRDGGRGRRGAGSSSGRRDHPRRDRARTGQISQAPTNVDADTGRNRICTVPGLDGLCSRPRPDLPGARLRSTRNPVRCRSHNPVQRRRSDASVEPEMPLPQTSSAQDILGLARQAATGCNCHLVVARWADLRHHAGQRMASPGTIRAQPRAAAPRSEATGSLRKPRRDDAQTRPNSRPKLGRTHCGRTQPQHD